MKDCVICFNPSLLGDKYIEQCPVFICEDCLKKHTKAKFLKKANVGGIDDCWNWLAGGRGNGYGALKFKGKVIDAHRFSWILHNGKIPKGKFVLHKCDNRKCINPNHLFLGTHVDNMIDAYGKGRLKLPVRTQFKAGFFPANAKITKEKAIEVYQYIQSNPNKTKLEIATIFGIGHSTAKDIASKRVYGLNNL